MRRESRDEEPSGDARALAIAGPSGTGHGSHLAGLMAEFLFILLPLIVVALVALFRGRYWALLSSPEWSFGASVAFGQTILKLVVTLIAAEHQAYRTKVENLGFIIAGLIVIGLVPSLVVLALILEAEKCTLALGVAQVVLFFLSFLVLFVLGRISDRLNIH